MSINVISTSQLGRKPSCNACGTGETVSFNWEYAKSTSEQNSKRDLSVFVKPRQLRYGTIYRCNVCDAAWYLFGIPEIMHAVPIERLKLIEEWNSSPISLPKDCLAILQTIGRTPFDQYGNGSEYNETPCTVTTKIGEEIDLAVVSFQNHAPFEESRNYRLASEVKSIKPSPFTLPLTVRTATAKADEYRMGFAPTLIEQPGKGLVVLNWTHHFLKKKGYDACKFKISKHSLNMDNLPAIYSGTPGIVYFIADEIQCNG